MLRSRAISSVQRLLIVSLSLAMLLFNFWPLQIVKAGGLDHFTISGYSDQKTTGVPFTITITAYGSLPDQLATGYTGLATITSDDPQGVMPTDNGTGWSNGSSNFTVTLHTQGTHNLTVQLSGAGAPVIVPVTVGSSYASVYRFYNIQNGSHFYTINPAERDMVISKWPTVYHYEGVSYTFVTNAANNYVPLYRFYNIKNGSHFYTPSTTERDHVIAAWPTTYHYEGIAYYVTLDTVGTSPVYRFYDVQNGSHFYTNSSSERDNVIARWPSIYHYEGVAYYLPNLG